MSRLCSIAVACVVALGALFPSSAAAHGPVNPVASDYLARVTAAPAGIQAKVVDGDQRMWLQVPPGVTVVVLDYRGAPYLRFSAAGVAVNQNSEMYYLNQTPVAETPPSNLTRSTPPDWQPASGGQAYEWHDGRLHALATVALSPGASYVGRWTIPVVLSSRPAAITGGLWHGAAPSIVWFWPIVVLLVCLMAGLRLRRPVLDARLARVLAIAVLVAIALAGCGRYLHGRPSIDAFGVVELGVILGLVGWGFLRVLRFRAGFMTYFAIGFLALWEGITLLPVLWHGYVLLAVPAFVARVATVVCVGGGAGLLLAALRLASEPGRPQDADSSGEYVDGEGGSLAHRVV